MTTTEESPRTLTAGHRACADAFLESALDADTAPAAVAYLEGALAAHIDADGSPLQGMTVERTTKADGFPRITLRELYAAEGKAEWTFTSPAHKIAHAAVAFIRGVMHAEVHGAVAPKAVRGVHHWECRDRDGSILFTAASWDSEEVADAFAKGCFACI